MSRRHRPAAGQLMLLFAGRHRRPGPTAPGGPRTIVSPTPYGSTDLAAPQRQEPSQAARGDDGPEGGPVRSPWSSLLPMPHLAGPRRELGEWSDHAVLSILFREAEHSGPPGRNRRCRVELTT